MQNQKITCPECGTQIELSETLAQPLIQAAKAKFESKLKAAQQESAKAKSLLEQERANIEAEKAQLDALIAKGVSAKRLELEGSIRQEVQSELQADAQAKEQRIQTLLDQLKASQKAQLDLEKEKQDLELKASSIELEITKGVNSKLAELREQATHDAEEQFRLKIAELEKKLSDTNGKLDEAKRKAAQGSQQLQGEVLELDFQERLQQEFPWDAIQEVKKGAHGADVIQQVKIGATQVAGKIVWETKRTQNWSNDWIPKLKTDSRQEKADLAVLVSEVLPQGVDIFAHLDGVWVVRPSFAIPLANALREGIIATKKARLAAECKGTKAESVYDYVTGAEFKARLEGIAEPFKQMQEDLQKERRQSELNFNKRQKQMDRVLMACFGMIGDLQGIAGHDLAQLEEVELSELGMSASRLEEESHGSDA